MRVISPRRVNERIRALIRYLELNETDVSLLKFTEPTQFDSEPQNCHFNVWVQCNKCGGQPQSGWLLAEDERQDFVEAQFHTVWRSPEGKLRDITPRADREKRVMFVLDLSRCITLCDHDGAPAILTYDNIRIHRGHLLTGLTRIKLVPQSEMIYEHGLATRSNP